MKTKQKTDYVFSRAMSQTNAGDVLLLCAKYYQEIGAPEAMRPDFDRLVGELPVVWADGYFPTIVAYHGVEPVGFITYELDTFWSQKPLANIYMLFCLPEHRGTGLGRKLIFLCEQMAKGDGAAAIYSSIISDYRQTKTAQNTFRRMGFEELAPTMRKVL